MASRVGIERLAQAAFWYYVQDLGQDEVARRLGTSRSNVSRLLRAAREQGVVRFEIAYPVNRNAALEQRLLTTFAAYGVREVVVARNAVDQDGPGPATDEAGVFTVARAGAEWLRHNLQDGSTLALFWGGTIKTLVDVARFDHKIDAHVVQLAGEWSNNPHFSGHDLVRDLARKMGGRHTYFNAPAVAASAAEATALVGGSQVDNALALARSADVAIVGVGSFPTGTTEQFLTHAGATDAEIDEATRAGVVGQIVGRFFDAAGEQVELQLHRRVVSVDLSDLRRIPSVVVVSSGTTKRASVLGALRGRLVDVLIVDESLGRALLNGANRTEGA
jgi:deoxyribonucleoside regulator